MANKEIVRKCQIGECISWGTSKILAASFLGRFPLDQVTELKWDHFYSGLPKQLKAMVTYLKATNNEKTYSDYLWVAWKAKKEEVMETSQSSATSNMSEPRATSFFPLQKL